MDACDLLDRLAGVSHGLFALIVLGRRIRGAWIEDRLLRGLGWIMLIVTIACTVWDMLPGHWNLELSLQFPYSYALRLITAIAYVVPILCTSGLRYRPTWRGYGVAYLATVLWAGLALIVNAMTGANYRYRSRGPDGVSMLDLPAPCPVYIFREAVIIAVVWAPGDPAAGTSGATPESGIAREHLN